MAKDFYHNIVKNALIKDGWRITHDPYRIKIEEIGYEIDLGAEPIIAGGQIKPWLSDYSTWCVSFKEKFRKVCSGSQPY